MRMRGFKCSLFGLGLINMMTKSKHLQIPTLNHLINSYFTAPIFAFPAGRSPHAKPTESRQTLVGPFHFQYWPSDREPGHCSVACGTHYSARVESHQCIT